MCPRGIRSSAHVILDGVNVVASSGCAVVSHIAQSVVRCQINAGMQEAQTLYGRGLTVSRRDKTTSERGQPTSGRGQMVNRRGQMVNGRGQMVNGCGQTVSVGGFIVLGPGNQNVIIFHHGTIQWKRRCVRDAGRRQDSDYWWTSAEVLPPPVPISRAELSQLKGRRVSSLCLVDICVLKPRRCLKRRLQKWQAYGR